MALNIVNGDGAGRKTLPDKYAQLAISKGIENSVPPSFFICQWWFESSFGTSDVAVSNNNWAGSSYFYSTSPYTRPSGIVVERGTSRPSSEGAHYMKFNSVDDYMVDYFYLLLDQGIYNIKNRSSFTETVRGLFKAGGATADYAASGVTHYVDTMQGIRNGINNRNDNILDDIDNDPEQYLDGDVPDPPDPQDPPDPELDFSNVLSFFTDFGEGIVEKVEEMLKVNLYDYGKSKTFANSFLRVDKTYSNTYKVKPSINFKDLIEDFINDSLKNLNNILDSIKPTIPDPDPDPDPDPEPSGDFYFPVDFTLSGINFHVPPHPPGSTQEGMEYGGPRSGRRHWAYDIGTGGNANVDCYAVKDGEVMSVNADGLGTVVIKHSTDTYYSQYMHLQLGKFTVSTGDNVKAGQKIGMVGGTGGYAIHLHIAISKNGTFGTEEDTINPRTYLKVTGYNTTELPNPGK